MHVNCTNNFLFIESHTFKAIRLDESQAAIIASIKLLDYCFIVTFTSFYYI